ncbi:variant erythrocyte surface antigen-1 family protein [Babesia caballi]|uniref:Variant erythrocyte surface antigen-1 family protein n=1 Tax=Babesia caballi TaxID=5871 RepID=A0AAV4LP19_BABCB|nr:variant erythrocyte surface antigen-1 family protein [Babesia caballi]
MTAGGKSLTEAPGSLKEAVDWVLCMSGYDDQGDYLNGLQAIQALAQQLKSSLSNVIVEAVNVNTVFQGDEKGHGNLSSNAPINSVASGLKELIGYSSGRLDTQNGIGKPNHYVPSYDGQPPVTQNDNRVVNILLGTIPLLFFGLGFIYWKCRGGWKNLTLSSSPLKDFLFNVGFPIKQLNEEKDGTKVAGMFNSFDEFRYVDSSSTFYDFLKKVEKQTKQELRNVNNVPLGALYLFTYQYLKTKNLINGSTTDNAIPTNENDLSTLLKQIGEAVKNPQLGSLTTLSKAYSTLSTAITTAINIPDPVEESSVVGPVSGTLVTAGLLGGGSAVYFNLGGAGTFLKGILRIP